jgi:hypothetical protein
MPKNKAAHAASDHCRLRQVERRRKEDGFGVISLHWRGILRDAGVPIEKDIVRLDGHSQKYKRKAKEGFWAPSWACKLLSSTTGGRCTRTLRVIILHYLQQHPDVAKCVIPATTLTDWATVYAWLYKEIKESTPPRRI